MFARLIVNCIQGHKTLMSDLGSQRLEWNGKETAKCKTIAHNKINLAHR
jgi:hypothetical protein